MEAQRKTKKSEPDDWLREAFLLASLFDRYGALFDERQRDCRAGRHDKTGSFGSGEENQPEAPRV